MPELNRRRFIECAGAGTGLALGAGVTGAQRGEAETEPGTEQEVAASFSASIDTGTLTIDGGELGDSGAGINLNIGTIDGSIDLDGEVYEDKTWTANNVQFPDVDPGQIVDPGDFDDLPVEDIEFGDASQIDVVVNSISGTYDPDAGSGGLVTGALDMLIEAYIEGTATGIPVVGEYDFTFDFFIDINEGEDLQLTTGTSNNLDGYAQNLESENAEAAVVCNDFTVPEAGGEKVCENPPVIDEFCINGQIGLPVDNPERNWIQLTLQPNWDGDPPQFGLPSLPGGQNPPKDLDGDGNHEDILGDGEVDIFDTQALFDSLDSAAVQENPEAFNFNAYSPDDEVTIFDVASHWKQNIYE
jgi:hypothetical protein